MRVLKKRCKAQPKISHVWGSESKERTLSCSQQSRVLLYISSLITLFAFSATFYLFSPFFFCAFAPSQHTTMATNALSGTSLSMRSLTSQTQVSFSFSSSLSIVPAAPRFVPFLICSFLAAKSSMRLFTCLFFFFIGRDLWPTLLNLNFLFVAVFFTDWSLIASSTIFFFHFNFCLF